MYFIMHANQTFLVMNKEKLGDLAATEAKQRDHAKVGLKTAMGHCTMCSELYTGRIF